VKCRTEIIYEHLELVVTLALNVISNIPTQDVILSMLIRKLPVVGLCKAELSGVISIIKKYKIISQETNKPVLKANFTPTLV
jgi:hypothetical protein